MTEITIIYGTDPLEMTLAILRDAGLEKRLRPDMKVVIKPNLVVPRPAEQGATTHREIVEGIVLFLKDCGISRPVVAEGAWVGAGTAQAFDICGYNDLAKKYGLTLVDTKKDKVLRKKAQGLTLDVCQTFDSADFLINVPVLKGHCQTTVTCCLKNMKGCIPDSEKRRYHTIGLHHPIAALNTVIRPDLHVVDALCGDATFEEGGNPVQSNRILLGTDPVLLDSYAATLLGHDPRDIEYIPLAARYGVGRLLDDQTEIRELCREKRPTVRLRPSGGAQKLLRNVEERGACSACYASLVYALHQVDAGQVPDRIRIGQGFQGDTQPTEAWGIGNCTKGCCRRFVPGCPPAALEIVKTIRQSGRSR